MWPEFKTFYLIPQEGLPYDEQREVFKKMIDICKELSSDIGHFDMLIQFDDEVKFTSQNLP